MITLIWEFTLLSILFSYDTTFGFVLTFAILQVFHYSREQDKFIKSLIIWLSCICKYHSFWYPPQLANFGVNGYFILVVFSFYQVSLTITKIMIASIFAQDHNHFHIFAPMWMCQDRNENNQELTAQRIKDIIIGRAEEYIQKSSNGEAAWTTSTTKTTTIMTITTTTSRPSSFGRFPCCVLLAFAMEHIWKSSCR